jgi:tight adherence protein B
MNLSLRNIFDLYEILPYQRRRSGALRAQIDNFRQVQVEQFDSTDAFGERQNLLREDPNSAASEDTFERIGRKKRSSLEERLKYADLAWIPVSAISLAQISISLIAFIIASLYLKLVLQIFSVLSGPLLINWLINRRIEKRVQLFDRDFAQFILSVVGMLKTGLNPIQAIEAASENLDEQSIVRRQVELMLERLRVGVSEERSIGAFGEDIDQPEIELFVQALMLSRRVGGSLSDTLDRLSKQIRKRQQFKISAVGAVSMQRGSIWAIIAVILGVQMYMLIFTPAMVLGAWTDPRLAGWAQGSLIITAAAVFVLKRITNIRI